MCMFVDRSACVCVCACVYVYTTAEQSLSFDLLEYLVDIGNCVFEHSTYRKPDNVT